ncbi:hypothetical protein [Shewanella khirikhana]|uniref:Uncharacterized protein n=1 Tax=Shewanella khirikhana TaxID=1965282 RepID=A0ABM7DXJ5_9GAMM|nr:hypothetical protein [Shewanella khirikhana]AZQ13306.1 hypothetical protein STH12_04280 [Shewanella khirikhana]
MSVYSKKLNKEWREAFEEYERLCGFEPMYQDDIDAGVMTPQEAWSFNIQFLENVLSDITHIRTPDLEEQEIDDLISPMEEALENWNEMNGAKSHTVIIGKTQDGMS